MYIYFMIYMQLLDEGPHMMQKWNQCLCDVQYFPVLAAEIKSCCYNEVFVFRLGGWSNFQNKSNIYGKDGTYWEPSLGSNVQTNAQF